VTIRERIRGLLERLLSVRNARPQDYHPKTVRIARVGLADNGRAGSDEFESPEWNFDEITAAYGVSSYCRQALDKYIELMFKEGYVFTGPNPEVVDYIRKRFRIMAIATGIPVSQFFIEMAEDLVKYANVFIVKARQKNNKGLQMQGKNLAGVSGKTPIAGYFLLNPTTITIQRDEHGTVKKYRQEMPGVSEPIEFNPEDIIHIYYKRDRGKAFGQPFVWPVLDDIRALREAEESVLRLLYRHLFPLYQYKVGIPQPGYEADEEEILAVRSMIESMPTDGGIVTPERHEIKVIGAEGEAIKAGEYLKYFEARVFTGLGVSATMMGRGDTANRSTADNMTSEMHDRIKAFQEVLSTFVNEFMIQELLLEAGYDPLENEEHRVFFRFNEIDTELKIKKENHAVYKYEHNAISEDEMRAEIGLDPVTDRAKMYMNTVQIPLAQAGVKPGNGNKVGSGSDDTDNKNQPQNQHGKRQGPKTKEMTEAAEPKSLLEELEYDAYLAKLHANYEACLSDVLRVIEKHFDNEGKLSPNNTIDKVQDVLEALRLHSMKTAEKSFTGAFSIGVREAMNDLGASNAPSVGYEGARFVLTDKHEELFAKLGEEIERRVKNAVETSERGRIPVKIRSIFDSLKYRLDFIASTELMYSYNLGYAMAAKELGIDVLTVKSEQGCDTCSKETSIDLTQPNYVARIPPFHTKCRCVLTTTS
jgi:hypothetical protein